LDIRGRSYRADIDSDFSSDVFMITWIAAYLVKTGLDQVDAFKWARRIFTGLLIVIGLLVLIVVIRFSSCGSPNADREREKVIEKQINANIAEAQKADGEVLVNQAIKDTNRAEKEREKAVNANLSERSGNYDEADRRLCEKFPAVCQKEKK
jgi:type VI protein secretion system component VasK